MKLACSLYALVFRLRQVDVKAEHFERQVQRLEQERDQWEKKYEVRCAPSPISRNTYLIVNHLLGSRGEVQEIAGGARGSLTADGISVVAFGWHASIASDVIYDDLWRPYAITFLLFVLHSILNVFHDFHRLDSLAASRACRLICT